MKPAAIAILLLCISQLSRAQTMPAEVIEDFRKELKQIEDEVAVLPKIEVGAVEQVLLLKVVDDMIAATTPLNRTSRVVVPDWKGILRLRMLSTRDSESVDRQFELLDRDLSDPSRGHTYTTVASNAGRVMIGRDIESMNQIISVQYIQDGPPVPGAPLEPPARLYVSLTDLGNPQNNARMTIVADDFWQLRYKSPSAIDRYLRPIARDLNQERTMFAVASADALQVLAHDFKTDAQVLERINAILPRLGSESFREREEAANEMRLLGPMAGMALKKIDRSKLSAEQSSAVLSLIEELASMPAEWTERLAANRNFLLDVLYTDDSNLRKIAIERLALIAGKKIELDGTLNANQRAGAIKKLRDELVPPTTQLAD